MTYPCSCVFVISRTYREEQELNGVKTKLVLQLCHGDYLEFLLEGCREEEFSINKGQVEGLCAEIRRTAGDAFRRGNTTENDGYFEKALSCLREIGRALYLIRPFSHEAKELLSAVLKIVDGYPPTLFAKHRELALEGLADMASREAGQHEQAMVFYRRLLALEGQPFESYVYNAYQIGSLLTIEGQLLEAIEFLASMLEQLPLKEQETRDQGIKSSKLEADVSDFGWEFEMLPILLSFVR